MEQRYGGFSRFHRDSYRKECGVAIFTRLGVCLGLLVVSVCPAASLRAAEPAPPATVEIAMPRTLFHGLHESLMKLGAAPFLKMMKTNTGMEGAISFPADARTLAAQLDAGKVHIGVMTGHEFAWAQSKYPDLMPIAVSVPMQPIQSFCVVAWDCKADNIGDLKDQKISLPGNHRDFGEMFLEKQKTQHKTVFEGQLNRPFADDAIFDVIEGRAGCTIIDCSTFMYFQRVNPGQFQNLKVLTQSEVFPNACIVAKKGGLDAKTIEKFKTALFKAQNDPIGKPMLTTWKLKGFAPVPEDYPAQLKAIEKAYPVPASWNSAEK